MGYVIGIIGVALCVVLCGVGSGIGLYKTASTAAGVTGEQPTRYGRVILLVLLPATQGVYGFLVGILASNSLDAAMTIEQGLAVLGGCLPMAISGLISAWLQAKAASNCILAVAKQASLSIKLTLFPAMIEFYAILGMIISLLLI